MQGVIIFLFRPKARSSSAIGKLDSSRIAPESLSESVTESAAEPSEIPQEYPNAFDRLHSFVSRYKLSNFYSPFLLVLE